MHLPEATWLVWSSCGYLKWMSIGAVVKASGLESGNKPRMVGATEETVEVETFRVLQGYIHRVLDKRAPMNLFVGTILGHVF